MGVGQALHPPSHIISVQVIIRKAQLEFAPFGFPVAARLFLARPPLFSVAGTFIVIVVVVVVVVVVFVVITIVAVTIVTLLAFSSFYNS